MRDCTTCTHSPRQGTRCQAIRPDYDPEPGECGVYDPDSVIIAQHEINALAGKPGKVRPPLHDAGYYAAINGYGEGDGR